MKILLYTDNHWSQYSSIVRKRGAKYSIRLENQIQSINWAMRLAEENQCMATICLGDFFDKPEMNAEEISALKDVKWAGMSNYFIAGNHEMGLSDHSYSSAKVFDLLDTGEVLTKPQVLSFSSDTEICILPYVLESNRKALDTYFPQRSSKKRIILSHNDIAGIQMGKFLSETGFSIEEIEENCDLFLNGHLHNGTKITDKIINLGNLTGQNFSEDAFVYDHCAFILDTDTLKVAVFENPCALNFYKLDATMKSMPALESLKQNAVVTLKCYGDAVEGWKSNISKCNNIIESHLIIQPRIQVVAEDIQESLAVDHLETFKTYVLENFENTKELMEELAEVLR